MNSSYESQTVILVSREWWRLLYKEIIKPQARRYNSA